MDDLKEKLELNRKSQELIKETIDVSKELLALSEEYGKNLNRKEIEDRMKFLEEKQRKLIEENQLIQKKLFS